MMETSYDVSRQFGDTVYGAEGFPSHEEALINVYERAFMAGKWSPRKLREKWWQFWLPVEHTKIEKHFAKIARKTK